jgi:hypothetical protein
MTKMTKILQRRRSDARRVAVAADKPEHMLTEMELDRVTAGAGMTGGVVGTNA